MCFRDPHFARESEVLEHTKPRVILHFFFIQRIEKLGVDSYVNSYALC